MSDLRDSIDVLKELDRFRNTAIALRAQGLRSLRTLKTDSTGSDIDWVGVDDVTRKFCQRFTNSGSLAELALLVKSRNHYQPPPEVEQGTDESLLSELINGVTVERLLPIDFVRQRQT